MTTELRETYAGVWEGLTNTEIQERYPERSTRPGRAGERVRRGAVERARGADRACRRMLDAVKALPDNGTVVVVSHGAHDPDRRSVGCSAWTRTYWECPGRLANCCLVGDGRAARERWRLLEHNAGTLPEPVLGDDR